MSKTKNKVKFNLKNVHIAKHLDPLENETIPQFDTPYHIPGAVSATLDAQGDESKFFADGMAYWVEFTNNGYSGNLDMALIPDWFLQNILKEVLHATDFTMLETGETDTEKFALLFEVDGDSTDTKFCFYNVSASRPSVNANTTTESTTPDTDSLTISASKLEGLGTRVKTTAETPDEVKNNWYKKVYIPSTTPETPETPETPA